MSASFHYHKGSLKKAEMAISFYRASRRERKTISKNNSQIPCCSNMNYRKRKQTMEIVVLG